MATILNPVTVLCVFCAGRENGPINVTPPTDTGCRDSLIMPEGQSPAPHVIWATRACGQMRGAAGSLRLSATASTVKLIQSLYLNAIHISHWLVIAASTTAQITYDRRLCAFEHKS